MGGPLQRAFAQFSFAHPLPREGRKLRQTDIADNEKSDLWIYIRRSNWMFTIDTQPLKNDTVVGLRGMLQSEVKSRHKTGSI